ncbi:MULTISPECIES: hypothetical protein [Chryseobacterium]|uniref:N-acetyltransferase n=1 Tax=Chryseobacterium balustinum TaxID=246 RepID=A0AAX2IPT2_9FLAO|nr:hypothetical protein [Chryseobacterium balustinum]AZB28719.1 hypothetical protein EB354_05295 [Chryseobacterium balustinum]SKC12561.1 hypothetical protein SAMN05421800_14017 [Chryseobacterium balustinum]SQA91859.1 Uncharacterised protein [Chryseobacterium balustinum]
MSKFIVEENYNHHRVVNLKIIQAEIQEIFEEEINYVHSKIFLKRDEFHSIIGSIRVFKWNFLSVLPLEKIFKIKLAELIKDSTFSVWHIGRFAIKKGADTKGFSIFKSLLVFAINEVCHIENSIAVAECDSKLLRILNLLGLETTILSDPIVYLGSETIPVLFTYKSLRNFLLQHSELCMGNYAELCESVVLKEIA